LEVLGFDSFYRCVENVFGVQVKIPAVQRSNFLKEFWSIVEFLSVLPLIARGKLYLLRGYTLIAERYVFDTITTTAFFFWTILHFQEACCPEYFCVLSQMKRRSYSWTLTL
jgi:hypothetical protein